MNSYVDAKAEGPFNGTAETRAIAHKYIQEQIEAHEAIIRYYKRRQNALTATCRVPPEILARIFGNLVDDSRPYPIVFSPSSILSIKAASRVCSHWREVALATPGVWSTIPVFPPTWALEMLQRSKNVPLTVISLENISLKEYHVLRQALTSHLPRIKALILSHVYPRDRIGVSLAEIEEFFQLLDQHPAPILEWLDLDLRVFLAAFASSRIVIPSRVLTDSVSLRHLTLNGLGINWNTLPAFQHLVTFEISLTPDDLQPSVVQLLRFLSLVPVLETLSIVHSGPVVSPSVDTERVYMKYLKVAEIRGASLPAIDSLFDRLTFPKGNVTDFSLGSTTLPMTGPLDPPTITVLHKLVRTEDEATGNGKILTLVLEMEQIRCFKYTVPRIPEPPTTLELGTSSLGFSHKSQFAMTVLQSLCLDQLISLEINDDYGADAWTLLGNLPLVEDLFIFSGEYTAIEALGRVDSEQPENETQSTPAFRSLTSLTIIQWDLNSSYNMDTMPPLSIAQALMDCIRLRTKFKLPLQYLKLEHCRGAKELDLSLLEVVGQIEWVGFEGSEDHDASDEDTEED
ncbi:hypothetical protein H0H92_009309 [Tricholoma furcatifolium]|nr:hypothetical protein H0H92_009309 [Tricholoma furcatifolium]